MKVDYGEIIFQSTEGVTEDQGMVQFSRFCIFGDFVQSCYLDLRRSIMDRPYFPVRLFDQDHRFNLDSRSARWPIRVPSID